MKTVLVIIAIVFGIAYWNDPASLNSWGSAANQTGKLITKAVNATGEAVTSEAKSINNGTSIVNKVPGAVKGTVDYVAETVNQK